MGSLRDAVVASSRPAPVAIDIPQWGTTYVRILTLKEVIEQEADTKDEKDRPAILRAFCRLLCEADGTPVFDHKKPDDMEIALSLPWLNVRSFLEQGNKINRLAVEEPQPEKN